MFGTEKLKRLMAERQLSSRQVSERTGLNHDWLRKGFTDQSDKANLDHLAKFFGLRDWRDWFNGYLPPKPAPGLVKDLLAKQTLWPEIREAARIWERAEIAFLRQWINHPWQRYKQGLYQG